MQIVLCILALYSLAAFVATARDKRAARRGRRRMPEKAMVFLSFTGAGLGVLAAFYALRHKTKHGRLLALCWFGTLASYALAVWACVRFGV